jgi:antitoxin component HigA of HigAB toxin-antitoxin module
MKRIAILAASLSLTGCSAAQLAQYTGAAVATASVLKQIGQDIVTFDCANADLIYVIAKDAGASSRVQNVLAANRQIAIDACPALNATAKIIVQTGATVAAPAQ